MSIKEIFLNRKVKIFLEDPNINTNNFVVTFSVRDDIGNLVKDNSGTPIILDNKPCTYDDQEHKYYCEFALNPDCKGRNYSLLFNITTTQGVLVSSDFYKQTLIINRENLFRFVPADVFIRDVINSDLDADNKAMIESYPKSAIEEAIDSSTGEIEDELELSLTPRTVENELHDWYRDNMRDTYWMIQAFKWPIISVQSYSLWYGNEKMLELSSEYMSVQKEMGILEYVPTAGQPFYIIYNAGIEASQVLFFNHVSTGDRIPNVFRVSYTHGLDYMNLPPTEQASIRTAISRRTMINKIASITDEIRKGSEQMAVDGASYAKYSRGIEWLNIERDKEKKWFDAMRRKYNKEFLISVT